MYRDSNWKAKLTSYNGKLITYDAIGNPLTYYNGNKFVWQNGRELAGLTTSSGTGIVYTYNADGIRTSKKVGSTKTTYTLEGDDVVYETNGTDKLWYYYDEGGNPVSFELNGTSYHYVKNLQGDVIAIVNDSGAKVVEYKYNSWGKLLSTTGSLASTVGVKNPYRYRGYRYDTETGLYYLQSRYYDHEIGRFINADSSVDTGDTVLSTNMFAYSENDSVNNYDDNGFAKKKTSYKRRKRSLRSGFDMWTQLPIKVGINLYLKNKGWKYSARFLEHALLKKPKDLVYNNNSDIAITLKNSKEVKAKFKEFKKNKKSILLQ